MKLIISGIPFGFGLLAIFQGSYQYLMDAYGPYAASAVSVSSFHLLLYPALLWNEDGSNAIAG
jgi:hypothetical protein